MTKEGRPKLKTLEIQGKATIKCGEVLIKDKGRPFTTEVFVNDKPLADLGSLRSFKYEVTVQKWSRSHLEPGQAKITVEYYPKSVMVKKDDEKERL